jgi:superfamily I DNA/RNA helicase
VTPTEEQQLIIDKIQEPDCDLVKVDAVAGAGKTALLQAITAKLKPLNGLYLAYNKAIADEAQRKFGITVDCKTTHSLAYRNTVGLYKLNVGFFGYKNIKERVTFEKKILIVDILNKFCLSRYDNFDMYKEDEMDLHPNYTDDMFTIAKESFNKMVQGKIDITHAGYLKMYHMLLAHKKIEHNTFDLFMLDEAGDLNEVTLEIFKLIPATKKLMVGDKNQNIYTFNGTINGFERMEGVGVEMNMTKSFRCSENVAKRIEHFCQKYIDPAMKFEGTKTPVKHDGTVATISRNNSSLVGEMIQLNKRRIKYNLTRKAKVIFELIMILLNLKPGGNIFSPEWRHLQEDVNDWNRNPMIKDEFKTSLGYIASIHSGDQRIKSTVALIKKYDIGEIYAAYNHAIEHEKEKGHKYTLSTAHSMKGLEYDIVRISPDLNESVQKVIEDYGSDPLMYGEKQIETMRLYYVACSRTINTIENAQHLPPEYDI